MAMRIAALYDIHGNLPALEAVLHDVTAAGADAVVVGGDVVPGPMPEGVLAALDALDVPVHYVRGNGEREVLAQATDPASVTAPEAVRAVLAWTAAQLSPARRRQLAAWPPALRLERPAPVLFCHATPRSDTELFTRHTPVARLRPVFEDAGVGLVVCGHTHMPFDRRVGAVRVVNAGSVGMPFGAPEASWLWLGATVSLRRTAYDREVAAARIRATTYPEADAFVRDVLLDPPSEAAMNALFERQALRPAGP